MSDMTKCRGAITKETPRAYWFEPDDGCPPLWIPKSQSERLGDVLWVATWLAKQEGLGDD